MDIVTRLSRSECADGKDLRVKGEVGGVCHVLKARGQAQLASRAQASGEVMSQALKGARSMAPRGIGFQVGRVSPWGVTISPRAKAGSIA